MPRQRALSIRVPHPPRARREGEQDTINGDRQMQLTCGVDWAEAHHDVALVDMDGAVVARSRIDTGASGFNDLLALIAKHGGSAEHTAIAVETDKNLLVVALAEAGFTVYPINPRAVARYRERHGQAGAKSDPGDAAVLAHILRTDRHLHRPLPAVSEQARAIKALARQHQEAVWALQHTVNRLRSVLQEFYPQVAYACSHRGMPPTSVHFNPTAEWVCPSQSVGHGLPTTTSGLVPHCCGS